MLFIFFRTSMRIQSKVAWTFIKIVKGFNRQNDYGFSIYQKRSLMKMALQQILVVNRIFLTVQNKPVGTIPSKKKRCKYDFYVLCSCCWIICFGAYIHGTERKSHITKKLAAVRSTISYGLRVRCQTSIELFYESSCL